MKNLILIPFMALVGCANNDTVQTITEPDGPDPLFSFREEEYNDYQELSNVIDPGNRFEYQFIGTLFYGDVDWITNVVPSEGQTTVHVTLDIEYPFGTFAAIFTKDENGEEQMIWTRLVRDTEEVYFVLPEGTTWWDFRIAGSSLYVKEYVWRAEVEVY